MKRENAIDLVPSQTEEATPQPRFLRRLATHHSYMQMLLLLSCMNQQTRI